MEVNTSLSILKELAAHSWDTNDTTDLGLTSVYGFPRLGVHTLRHNKLIMLINFHARRLLKNDIFWSTITVDASNEERTPLHEHKKSTATIVFVLGAYIGGATFSPDGATQTHNEDVGKGVLLHSPLCHHQVLWFEIHH